MQLHRDQFGPLAPFLKDRPTPDNVEPVISIVALWTTEDEAVYQTQPGELDTLQMQRSFKDPTMVSRVEIRSEKIHHADRSKTHQILRMLRSFAELEPYNCEKGNLCGKCAPCVLRGSINREAGKRDKHEAKQIPIESRVRHCLGLSIDEYELVTAEADFSTLSTQSVTKAGMYMGRQVVVRPGSQFATVIELKGLSPAEFVIAINAIGVVDRIGARQSTMGSGHFTILGMHAGPSQILSSKDLVRGFKDIRMAGGEVHAHSAFELTQQLLNSKRFIGRNLYRILTEQEVSCVLAAVDSVNLYDRGLLERLDQDAARFIEEKRSLMTTGHGGKGVR